MWIGRSVGRCLVATRMPGWRAVEPVGGVGDQALADLPEDLEHGGGGRRAVGPGGQGGPHPARQVGPLQRAHD